MKEMLCRCSLEDLAIWYIPAQISWVLMKINGFLKTGGNLSYLELFEFILWFL